MAVVINPTSLAEVVQVTRPLTLARDRTVPVVRALQGLVPDGGLVRGSVVGVGGEAGATSLALALAAGPSAAGSWVAVVGHPDLGLALADEVGVALDRLALVDEPTPEHWAGVVAALIGAVDLVVVAPPRRARAADVRRLAARARERGTVLVQTTAPGPGSARGSVGGAGLEFDLRLQVVASSWQGVGSGHGHLRARRLTVDAGGRRRAARPRRAELWLPDERGQITVCGPDPAVAYAGSDIDRLVPPLREVG
jgi:hypothetical protein